MLNKYIKVSSPDKIILIWYKVFKMYILCILTHLKNMLNKYIKYLCLIRFLKFDIKYSKCTYYAYTHLKNILDMFQRNNYSSDKLLLLSAVFHFLPLHMWWLLLNYTLSQPKIVPKKILTEYLSRLGWLVNDYPVYLLTRPFGVAPFPMIVSQIYKMKITN